MKNTTHPSFTRAEAQQITGWCAQVRDAYNANNHPIHDGDERLAELEQKFGQHVRDAGFSPTELGEMYAGYFTRWPDWPLPAPEWATNTRIYIGSFFPELSVVFEGPRWKAGNATAYLCKTLNVFASDFQNPDGTTERAGSIEASYTNVDFGNQSEPLTPEDALNLSIAIEDAIVAARAAAGVAS